VADFDRVTETLKLVAVDVIVEAEGDNAEKTEPAGDALALADADAIKTIDGDGDGVGGDECEGEGDGNAVADIEKLDVTDAAEELATLGDDDVLAIALCDTLRVATGVREPHNCTSMMRMTWFI
jgi:hypothetical protein